MPELHNGAIQCSLSAVVPCCAVTFEGYYFDRTDAIILACSRIAGISSGVLIALALTCIVFPQSGTGEVRHGVGCCKAGHPSAPSILVTQPDIYYLTAAACCCLRM